MQGVKGVNSINRIRKGIIEKQQILMYMYIIQEIICLTQTKVIMVTHVNNIAMDPHSVDEN